MAYAMSGRFRSGICDFVKKFESGLRREALPPVSITPSIFSLVGIIKLHESFGRVSRDSCLLTPSVKTVRLTAKNNFSICYSSSSSRGETVPSTDINISTSEQLDSVWQVILEDDDFHTYQYVIEMLGKIFGYSQEKAFALARIVDTNGRVAVYTDSKAQCEEMQNHIHAYGADPRIESSKGSMTAIIEPL
ncbi:MAG: hypothetical protein CL718_00805 [Chloroflexi bacterium]|nr:hypothetical protein [Chloroflexota bacterium]